MPRYIDVDRAIELIRSGDGTPMEKAMAEAFLMSFTPADVVEVVRCKDCKYSEDLGMAGIWCNHPDNRNPLGCRPTDYCNDGERKEQP